MNKFEARALKFMGLEVLLKAPPTVEEQIGQLNALKCSIFGSVFPKEFNKELDLGSAEEGRL